MQIPCFGSNCSQDRWDLAIHNAPDQCRICALVIVDQNVAEFVHVACRFADIVPCCRCPPDTGDRLRARSVVAVILDEVERSFERRSLDITYVFPYG
jgi:hypothetical protein